MPAGVTDFSGAKNRRLAEWDKLCFRLDNHFLQEPIMEETKLPEIKVEKSVKQLLNLCQKGNSPSIFYWERLADRFRPYGSDAQGFDVSTQRCRDAMGQVWSGEQLWP
jgi:hypothetical protein